MNQMNNCSELLPQTLRCKVLSVEALNQDTHRIRLAPQDSQPFAYLAGQYLELLLPGGHAVPFSIASAPHHAALELNIMHVPTSDASNAVMSHLQQAEEVDVCLPKGDCALDARMLRAEERLLFIAASTGFAQIKSMVEHALAAGIDNPIAVYWGVRHADHLYDLQLAQRWEAQYPGLTFVPVVSEPLAAEGWQGATGLVHERALADIQGFEHTRVYVSGSPAMVYAVEDAFRARGMGDGQMFSDVFSYAPR